MSLSAKIETIANVATIVVALLISTVLIKAYVLPVQPRPIGTPSLITPGKTLDGRSLGVDWAKNRRTLVMAISTTCRFCTESAPFFRRLADEIRTVRLVAVMPQSASEAQSYLRSVGVQVDQVKQASLGALGVRATPTLALVNDAGVVTDVWVGKLQPDQENQVLDTLQKKSAER